MIPKSSIQPRLPRFDASPPATRRSLFPRWEKLAAVAAGISEPMTRRAAELSGIAATLPGFDQEDWEKIPVVCAGERLIPGATYLDLRALRLGPFSAPVEAYPGEGAWYVAKADVAPQLWLRLVQLAEASAGR